MERRNGRTRWSPSASDSVGARRDPARPTPDRSVPDLHQANQRRPRLESPAGRCLLCRRRQQRGEAPLGSRNLIGESDSGTLRPKTPSPLGHTYMGKG
ncbi:hypothetical protein Cni_G03686 [Canna indica]|uniref:Uncharacterized protein n=1 Tax=Canna indica TaxID=4628 RepID=A0AAQ3JSC1_9LILI|nr:hypothetical protein Cni_G03686 [Canna indica]